MKNIKYVLLVVLILLTVNVKAISCDSKESARLKELAKKVEFDYDYKVSDGYADFSIHAVNLNKDIRVLIIEDYFNGIYKEFKGESEATLSGFSSGEKVVITVKGFVPNDCSGITVYTKTIKLPYYNRFYDENLCRVYEDFKYCKLLIDKNISQNDFDKEYEKYLKNKEKTVPQEGPIEEGNNLKLLYIIGGGVLALIVVGVVVMLIIKKRNKNKL